MEQDALLQWIHDNRERIEFTLVQSPVDFNEQVDKGSLPYGKVSEQFIQAYTSLVKNASDVEIGMLIMGNATLYELFEESQETVIAIHVGSIKFVD